MSIDHAALADWVRRAMRFIDLCDADAAGYDELHEDAEQLTHAGYALFGIDADAHDTCIAKLDGAGLTALAGLTPMRVCRTCSGHRYALGGVCWTCHGAGVEPRHNPDTNGAR